MTPLLFALVVDQIDDGLAAVEVDGHEIVYLSVELLPPDVREGDRLTLLVDPQRTPAGAHRPGPTRIPRARNPHEPVQESSHVRQPPG
jgi:hypothetical protein